MAPRLLDSSQAAAQQGMVHIRVTQTWRQRFAEHEPSGARPVDESGWAVNLVRVQEKSSIFQLPGRVLDLLRKGGQV